MINELSKGDYNIYHNDILIGSNISSNSIPGRLMGYYRRLEENKFEFNGENIQEKISNLEIILKLNSKSNKNTNSNNEIKNRMK